MTLVNTVQTADPASRDRVTTEIGAEHRFFWDILASDYGRFDPADLLELENQSIPPWSRGEAACIGMRFFIEFDDGGDPAVGLPISIGGWPASWLEEYSKQDVSDVNRFRPAGCEMLLADLDFDAGVDYGSVHPVSGATETGKHFRGANKYTPIFQIGDDVIRVIQAAAYDGECIVTFDRIVFDYFRVQPTDAPDSGGFRRLIVHPFRIC